MVTPAVSKEELKKDVDAYMAAGGNKSEAARMRGLHRHTYRDRLTMAERVLGIQLGKVVDGRYEAVKAIQRPLPPKGCVARYILTSAQNNTHAHEAGLKNLLAYGTWTKQLKRGNSFEFITGTFSYAIDAYGAKSVKRGSYDSKRGANREELWYAPSLVPYIVDESIMLAPGLMWCGEMNILPTATNPLTGLDDYNGRASNIVPHVKQTLESVASLPDEATKFNYSTGGITLRNYIQKRAGIVAERKHTYGALLVEVDDAGSWYVRHLVVDDAGAVYDIGPSGFRGVRVINGIVDAIRCNDADDKRTFVDSIMWGDVHASEMDLWVRLLGWSKGGFLDQVRPRRQFWHDLFSMRSRGHHEMKDFLRTFEKHVAGEGDVQGEVAITADFMHDGVRYKSRDGWDCETVVIRSNHDRHLDRWVNEADPKKDPANAVYYTKLMAAKLDAIANGDRDFNILQFALNEAGAPKVRFNGEDESYVICKRSKVAPDGIECGLHGDLGANGARGSTRGLRKLGRPINKDHDHTAGMLDQRGVMSGGACSLSFPYMKGPNAHSVSHIVAFDNGARQIVTFWNRKARA
jgi:hypothetical protein